MEEDGARGGHVQRLGPAAEGDPAWSRVRGRASPTPALRSPAPAPRAAAGEGQRRARHHGGDHRRPALRQPRRRLLPPRGSRWAGGTTSPHRRAHALGFQASTVPAGRSPRPPPAPRRCAPGCRSSRGPAPRPARGPPPAHRRSGARRGRRGGWRRPRRSPAAARCRPARGASARPPRAPVCRAAGGSPGGRRRAECPPARTTPRQKRSASGDAAVFHRADALGHEKALGVAVFPLGEGPQQPLLAARQRARHLVRNLPLPSPNPVKPERMENVMSIDLRAFGPAPWRSPWAGRRPRAAALRQ